MLELSLIAFGLMVASWVVLPNGPRRAPAAAPKESPAFELNPQGSKA